MRSLTTTRLCLALLCVFTISASMLAIPAQAAATLTSAYLGTPGSANTMVAGNKVQFTAYGVYSDGTTATLPDAQGDAVTGWSSSNAQAASISSAGLADAMVSGTTNIRAMVGSIQSSGWGLTISGSGQSAPASNSGRPTLTGCGGPTVNVNSNMSQSTLQNAIQSAPNCAFVLFAPGSYSITATIHVPCSVSLGGPPVHWAHGDVYTAKITSAVPAGSYPFKFPACTSAASVQYLSCNGGRPSPDGGGCFYVASGDSNLTVTENYMYGNQGNASGGNNFQDGLLFFDGNASSTVDNKDTVTWNQFGQSGDCSNLMSNYTYSGLGGNGGFCNGLGLHDGMSNLVADNNIFSYQEQGMKDFEGQGECVNCVIAYNDFNHIHRIDYETQANIGGSQPTSMFITYNSIHDQYDTNFGSWGFSSANGCTSGCVTNTDNNVLINNTQATTAGKYTPGAVEVWGTSADVSGNLVQGNWANGLMTSRSGKFTYDDNNFCMPVGGSTTAPGKGGYFNDETSNAQSANPEASGNTFSTSTCAQTSVTPTISPAGGSFSGSQTVTFTNPGDNRDQNTGIWYTTDGTTPVPGSGTAQYIQGGGSITANTNTVKAVGMWGAQNQPTSYASGYGYVPSAVVTANYTSGAAVKAASAKNVSAIAMPQTTAAATTASNGTAPVAAAATSVAIVPAQATVAIGGTTQLKAIATLSDGSTKDVTANFTWTSSDTRTITTNSAGLLSGLATGKATITGSYGGSEASAAAVSSIGDVSWSGPIVITKGGTYSGNWQSTDSKTPAVTVATAEPVVIENAHISSVADLIKTSVAGSNLTVRNSVGVAVNPEVKGQANGAFLDASSPAQLDVENNYVENAGGGVLVHGYSGNKDAQHSVVIRANRGRNMNGQLSDGNGGYLAAVGSNVSASRFIELDKVQAVPGIDLGWNEVINYPGHSLVADNIDVKQSSGTVNQPLEIHDSYIQGAYPYNAAQANYAGGGIKTEGTANDSAQQASAFNDIHDNQVVGTVSYGIEFTAGHDNTASNNRVISDGTLPDGTKLAAQGVGMANGNGSGASASMYNNTMHDNLIGWACWTSACSQSGARKDQSFPASPADYSANSVLAAQPITSATENNEYQIWLNKTASAGIAVGPSL